MMFDDDGVSDQEPCTCDDQTEESVLGDCYHTWSHDHRGSRDLVTSNVLGKLKEFI